MLFNRMSAGFITLLLGLGAILLPACGETLTDTEYVLRAQEQKSKGEIQAAVIEAKNALQKNPKNGEARLLLASLHNDLGEGLTAESDLNRARELGISPDKITYQLSRALFLQQQYQKIVDTISAPEKLDSKARAEIWAIRAEARLLLGDLDRADADIEEALRADINSPSALLAAARLQRRKGDLNLALEYENKAQKAGPDDPEVWIYMGDSNMARGLYSDAQTAYNQALKLPGSTISRVRSFKIQLGLASSLLAQNKDDDALHHINSMLKIDSKHPIPNYLRGLAAYRKNDHVTAVDFLQRSHAQKSTINNILALLGASNFALGNFQQAEEFLAKHLADNPQDINARKLLATTLINLKQPEKAVAVLGSIKNTSQDTGHLLTVLGTAASLMGDASAGRAVLKKAVETAPNHSFLHAKLAESYFREGDFDQTLKELEKSATDREATLQSRMRMVLTHMRKHDIRTAMDLTQKLTNEYPREAVVFNLLGGVHLANKDSAQAQREFLRAIELDAGFYPAMVNLGQLELTEGKAPDAIAWFQKAIEKNKNDVSALTGLAHAEAEQGHIPEATEWLERARKADAGAVRPRIILARAALDRGDINVATELAQEIVAANPNSSAGLALLGDVQMRRGDYTSAESYLVKLVKLERKSANAHFHLGNAQIALNKISPARASYKEALKVEQNFLPAILALANLEVRAGNNNAALQLADGLINREPNAPAGYVLRGDLMLALKNYSAAESSYSMAAQRKPSATLAIKQYQALAGSKAPFEKLVEPLRSWLNTNPDDDAVLLAWADAHVSNKRDKEATEIYQRILQFKPNHIIALNNLAIAYQALNDPRALQFAEQAYRLDVSNPQLADTLGWILVRQNELQRGKQLLEQSLHDLAGDPSVSYHLAVAKNKTGDTAGARNLLTKILTEKKSFEGRADAEALLKTLR